MKHLSVAFCMFSWCFVLLSVLLTMILYSMWHQASFKTIILLCWHLTNCNFWKVELVLCKRLVVCHCVFGKLTICYEYRRRVWVIEVGHRIQFSNYIRVRDCWISWLSVCEILLMNKEEVLHYMLLWFPPSWRRLTDTESGCTNREHLINYTLWSV